MLGDYATRLQISQTVSDNHRIWDGWIETTNSVENWVPFNPFDWPSAFVDNPKEGMDCGVILLPKFYLKPLSQRMVGWSSAEMPSDCKTAGYVILGEPFRGDRIETFRSQQSGVDELAYVPQPKLVFVDEIDPLPDYENCPRQQFFGRIQFRDELPNIQGMSGGPIFRVVENEGGQTKYLPTAIQSRWIEASRTIIGTEYTCCYQWGVEKMKECFGSVEESMKQQFLIMPEENS